MSDASGQDLEESGLAAGELLRKEASYIERFGREDAQRQCLAHGSGGPVVGFALATGL